MRQIQKGFTLIELVMVIVIIGVLAAVAVPKFVDLSGEANQAAVSGVAGALASAASINYAAKKAGSPSGVTVANCTDVSQLLQGGGVPAGYTVTAAAITANATVTCTVTHTASSKLATFPATGT
jgi:MSHA pilin protein MshA